MRFYDKKLNPLGAVLEDALRKLELGDAALEARAVMLWPELVGPQVSLATEAVRMQGGTLLVTTRSSAWSQELSFQKIALTRKYKERLGKEFVKDFRFSVGSVRRQPHAATNPAPPEEEVRRIRLSDPDIARIRTASSEAEPELGQAIRRALTREAQLRYWQLSHGARTCPGCGSPYRTQHDHCPACRLDIQAAIDRKPSEW
jgi:predicted nucleic acid-binding Zn ribbon protein